MSESDQEYINYDPFEGDDSEITCRKVAIRTARKEHDCYAITLNGKEPQHRIKVGQRYRHETARVDGEFGSWKMCLECIDKDIKDLDDDDEDE